MSSDQLPPAGDGWIVTSHRITDGTLIGRVSIPRALMDRVPPLELQERWLTPAETDKLRRFRQPADQWRMLAGRFVLRSCLREHYDIAFAQFAFGEHNKPLLAPADEASASIDLNLTHDRHHVLAAFSASHDVGIDVAALEDFVQWEEFAGGYMDSCEIRWSRSANTAHQPLRAMRIWALKEAILKAAGHGLEIDPREIVLTPDAAQKIHSLPESLPAAECFALREWLGRDGMGAALARLSRPKPHESATGQKSPAMHRSREKSSCTVSV